MCMAYQWSRLRVHQAKWLPHTHISSHYSVTTAQCTQDRLSAPVPFRFVIHVIQPSMFLLPFFVLTYKIFVPCCLCCRQPPLANSPQLQPPLWSSPPVLHSLVNVLFATAIITSIAAIHSIFFISSHRFDSWTFVWFLCLCFNFIYPCVNCLQLPSPTPCSSATHTNHSSFHRLRTGNTTSTTSSTFTATAF